MAQAIKAERPFGRSRGLNPWLPAHRIECPRFTQIQVNEIIFVVEQAPEGGFTARALGESIITQGESVAELREQVRDAVHCHFDEGNAPKMIRLHFVRDEVIAA
jgi:hypothetical protein